MEIESSPFIGYNNIYAEGLPDVGKNPKKIRMIEDEEMEYEWKKEYGKWSTKKSKVKSQNSKQTAKGSQQSTVGKNSS